MSDIQLDTPIPTGPWTIYFHPARELKWTLNTFSNFTSMKTWRDFWTIMNLLKDEYLSNGMFFIMRDPLPPLWENYQNIRGGCYSFRCQNKDASDICIKYMIACMLGNVTLPDNKINGISISPKRGFNIIKIWNADSQKHNSPSDILTNVSDLITSSDILYTPFIQKKM
jgi:hypothetical protein